MLVFHSFGQQTDTSLLHFEFGVKFSLWIGFFVFRSDNPVNLHTMLVFATFGS